MAFDYLADDEGTKVLREIRDFLKTMIPAKPVFDVSDYEHAEPQDSVGQQIAREFVYFHDDNFSVARDEKSLAAAIDKAIADEREACAAEVEKFSRTFATHQLGVVVDDKVFQIARAIRARK